ncbi:DUF4215 domain-containing protein [Pseudoalteromonas sp.]|uniref:DUF4215 domain-containing protein n=1 Tax=Pseudoalteromonas sp. TaxID=53249 RepID=UPI003564C8A7
MKEGDPQMPCVNYATECPVFDTLELAKINSPIGDVYEDDYEYSSINNGAMIMRESVRSLIYGQELPWWRDGRTVPLVSALTAKRDNNGVIAYTGQYYDSTLESPIFRFQELTLEEYNGCRLAIKNNKLDTDSGGFCGDGFRTAGPEQCDDGNNIDGDGCSAICALE